MLLFSLSKDVGQLNEHIFSSFILDKKIEPFSTGCVAQSVTCLATNASLAADPGVGSLIPARSHTSVED